MKEVESDVMITLLASLAISTLMSIEQQLPPHSRKATAIKKVEDSISKLAALTGKPLDPLLVEIGVNAWNASLTTMQEGLEGIQ